MPTPTRPADPVTIILVNGQRIQVRPAIAETALGVDADGDIVVPLGGPGDPIAHPDGRLWRIPLTPCCQASGKGADSPDDPIVCRTCYAGVDGKYATHTTISVPRDLTGLLVRWDYNRQWFTARIKGTGTVRDSWRGVVVDPGNYTGFATDVFGPRPAPTGTWLPTLHLDHLTIVSTQQPGED